MVRPSPSSLGYFWHGSLGRCKIGIVRPICNRVHPIVTASTTVINGAAKEADGSQRPKSFPPRGE
jgi:hypothetical protein